MEGYRVESWGDEISWASLAEPDPGQGEVLIEVEACGIGLTVLNCINGDLANDPALLPLVPGHELVGRVVDLGEHADESLRGRKVAAYFYLFCGHCLSCREGLEQQCRNLAGWVGVHRDGGYAPRAVLPARNAIPIPDVLDPVEATVVPDAVATPVHVARRAQIGREDRVAVIGAAGGVGVHMVQVAKLQGAVVAGLDVGDAKLGLIDGLGVEAVDSREFDSLYDLRIGDGKPTVVIDFVGSAASLAWGRGILDYGGRQVLLTTFPGGDFSVSPREMVFREWSIVGSRYATVADLMTAADYVVEKRVKPVIGRIVGPTEVPSVHSALKAGSLAGRGALDWSGT